MNRVHPVTARAHADRYGDDQHDNEESKHHGSIHPEPSLQRKVNLVCFYWSPDTGVVIVGIVEVTDNEGQREHK